jgi:hypothetical protein
MIIRVYQKHNDDGIIWLFSWPFVVVLLSSLLVGGRAGSDVVVAASVYIFVCLVFWAGTRQLRLSYKDLVR